MNKGMIEAMLNDFSPISLVEMDEVRLMNRVDTKYAISLSRLPEVLRGLQSSYYMQEINGSRLNAYRTVYLDTETRAMYLAHHNGYRVREKIRVRAYRDSQSVFLEVKDKNNKGQTRKRRLELPDIMAYKQDDAETFLHTNSKYRPATLLPSLENNFYRITLVNKRKSERLTIDLNLSFRSLTPDSVEKRLDDLVIIELKQQGFQPSFAKKLFSELHIYSLSLSKYCLGTVMTVPEIKNNLFKKKMIRINKIRKKQYEFF